ncbi:hypothetical protein FB451DRAFT_191857 [Mycena latifolia]|nr:hypothetical protein FB451DRAFT_191857 [Mycena latifolia]
MPLVAAALTFGSFGDILEASKIARRIIDVLHKGGGSPERQKLISTLKAICDQLSRLTVLPGDHFTTRLWDEVVLCRSLLDQFYAKINSYQGFLGRVRMIVLEETELASWRAQISERRAALRDLLGPTIILQLHDVGEQVGRVGSQVQYLGSRVENVEAQVQSVGNEVGTLGVLMNTFLSTEVSRMGSAIRQVGTDVQAVQQAIHKISPHCVVSDPFFYIRNPLGERIPIPLSHYRIFDDLDLVLRAYLCNRPDAGGIYVDRGDYSIVSTDGAVIPRLRLRGGLRAGIEFDMSIIKRKPMHRSPEKCPRCLHTNGDAVEGSWVNCSNVTCEVRYQVSGIEEISSPQISRQHLREPFRQEDRAESFRLVQIFYVSVICESFAPRLMRLRCLTLPHSSNRIWCAFAASADVSTVPDPSPSSSNSWM